MPPSQGEPAAIAFQHLRTCQFLGVEFLPVQLEASSTVIQGDARKDVGETVQQPAMNDGRARKARTLAALRERHDATCPHCTTATGHNRTVFGEGDPAARLMFIGEAPGEEEDRTGRPFVGRAGQKLDDIILAMGLSREVVYIANVLKSRPPNNRTPLQPEVDGCSPFLREQVRIIRPAVIVALGGPAAKLLLQTETGITRLRGQWGQYVDDDIRIPIMPTFHPAYLLRNYTVDTRRKMWSDMQAVIERLGIAS